MRGSIQTFLIVVCATLAVAGCPKGGSTPAGAPSGMPAAVSTYPALRWVPADVSYAVTARTASDLSALLRELASVAGILGDFDPEDVSDESRQAFGFDILSGPSLRAAGVDPDGAAAVYSQGFSPTVVVRLADPAAFESFLDGWRDQGMSVQSQVADGVEVFSTRLGRDVAIGWAVIDGWLLAHLGIEEEREAELAWLAGARGAAGGLAGHADFTAALDAGRAHAGAVAGSDGLPPVVGAVRPPALVATLDRMMGGRGAAGCLGVATQVPRVLLSGGVAGQRAGGSIVLDLADAAGAAAAVVPAPPGWYTARAGAPIQLDVGFDVRALSGVLARCDVPLDRLLGPVGGRTAHAFIKAFDGEMPAVAGAYADLAHDRAVRELLRGIPMLGQFSSKRKVGAVEVVDVDVPFVGQFSYHLAADRAIGAMGRGVIEAVLGAGEPVAGELLHLELHPPQVPVEAWDLMLQMAADVASASRREQTIRRLQRWDVGAIDARLDGGRIVVTAAGTLR